MRALPSPDRDRAGHPGGGLIEPPVCSRVLAVLAGARPDRSAASAPRARPARSNFRASHLVIQLSPMCKPPSDRVRITAPWKLQDSDHDYPMSTHAPRCHWRSVESGWHVLAEIGVLQAVRQVGLAG